MPFIEGFLTAIPSANREAFIEHAQGAARVLLGFGAARVVDGWGDDVPEGKLTDFQRAVALKDDETVGFGWIEYPDRPTRDVVSKRMMNDPAMKEIGDMPFDGGRMVFGGFEPVIDEGPRGKARYIEGFVGAVPDANKETFVSHVLKAAPVFLEAGALRVVECWGADVPEGKLTDFYRSVQAKDDETVIFSWIEWPDKPVRDEAQAKLVAGMDTLMADNPMPFDGKRMIFGGFEIVSDAKTA